MGKTVRDVLQESQSPILALQSEDFVFSALQKLAKVDVGAAMVFNKEGSLVGIFSERDYARKVELLLRPSRETKVREVMTQQVYVVEPDKSIEECLSLMNAEKVRHLPVVHGQEILGFISILDVARSLIQEKSQTVLPLQSYVSKTWPF
ncbi:MAG: CBS domain-containing protein [Bdellovibrionales bacterium]|nr:CBS domain-containing protein [Bdellovibrionales bacterium]